MSKPTQLDTMLQREYEAGNYVRFWNLARRWLRRRRKDTDDENKGRKVNIMKMIARIPKLRQERILAEKLIARSNHDETPAE